MMAETMRLTAVVSGRVQGVGFRDWTRRSARSLGLAGFAVNRPDGRVEIRVEGDRDACERLLDALYSGQAPGRVHGVDVSWSAATGDLEGFRLG
jgi:acylphosphatase